MVNGINTLGAFDKLRKATISFITFSVRMEKLSSYWKIFVKFDIWEIFRKSVERIHVWLNFDKNGGLFTWGPMHIYDDFRLNSP
jgi:hypothetical protein